MLTRKTIFPIAAAAFIGVSTFVTALPAFAQTPTSTPAKVNFFDGLVKYIADKFHLDQTQVKSAVTEYKNQHQTAKQQVRDDREKTRLDTLVKNGKITQDQEKAILAELAALKTTYDLDSLRSLTADQRKAKFEAMQGEIQAWAKDHNIEPKYLMSDMGPGMRMGIRRGKWGNQKVTGTVTPTPTPM